MPELPATGRWVAAKCPCLQLLMDWLQKGAELHTRLRFTVTRPTFTSLPCLTVVGTFSSSAVVQEPKGRHGGKK
ncbi:hypothetical protein LZ31DRAFT_560094 [Colletotrichum somersetense]|nr:hypothetical protein LZ31DRAFT_560094 [Colletotrichum somersetense]